MRFPSLVSILCAANLLIGCAARAPLAPVVPVPKIMLTAPEGKRVEARSGRFPIEPGHYEITARFKAEGLGLSPSRTLAEALTIRLRLFDAAGSELNQPALFRKESIDGAELAAPFRGIASDSIIAAVGDSELHLVPRYYPFDGGWVPESARSAELEAELNGPGAITISEIEIRRSKWNLTLAERVAARSEISPAFAGAGTEIRAANSQGSPASQRAYLEEALPHLPPDSINSVCIEVGPGDVVDGRPTEDLSELVELLRRRKARVPDFTFGISFNPYWTDRNSWDAGRITVGADETMRRIERTLSPLFARGASYLLFRTDDLVPRGTKRATYYLDSPADVSRFGTLGTAHGYLLTQVRNFLKREAPEAALYFVPPWYANVFIDDAPDLARRYFRDLAPLFPAEAGMIWTGPAVRSLVIDELPAARFEAESGFANALLWDNSLYARKHRDFWLNKPGRIKHGSFLEPYEVEIAASLLGGKRPFVFINGDFSPLGTIQYVTAGRFFASPASYVPERELWRYLSERFGEKQARAIIQLDGALTAYLEARAEKKPDLVSEIRRLEVTLREVGEELHSEPLLLRQLADTAAEVLTGGNLTVSP